MTMKKLVTFGMISSLALLLFMVVPTYSQAGYPAQTVVIDQSVGGTTNPGAGTWMYDYGQMVTLVATPLPGYHFVEWDYLGPADVLGLNLHNGPVTFSTPTVQFNCAGGYSVEFQAVFALD
jgi:hypothetical protein